MKKFFILICGGLTLMAFNATAQKKIKTDYDNVFGPAAKITPEYTLAENLAKEALAKLRAGETRAGDSLIKKSIATYPVHEVMNYAKELILLPDVVGANLVMSQLKERVAAMSGKILIPDPLLLIMQNPNFPAQVKEYDKERAYFNFLTWIYDLNRLYASRPYILAKIADLSLPQIIEDKKPLMGFDYEFVQQNAYKFMGLVYMGEYDKARSLIDALPINSFMTKELKLNYHINVDIATEQYPQAIAKVDEISKNKLYQDAVNVQYFMIYSAMGDDKALAYYNKIDKSIKENNYYYYKLAKFYLAKKDFITALNNIEKSNMLRKEKVITSEMLVEGWDFYRTYGEILTGLKQYDKARDNFKISLIYYPGYKETTEALAKMEILAGTAVSTDKTAPEIAITEPTPNRGLKVVSLASNVMVKGTATDVSGIKEVSINGIKVFAQPNGDFWGDVPMKIGLNKILVVAIDMAGNKSEKTFDIEKSAPATTAATP
ncbi:MAG: hypothetical protein EOP00_17600, partial [Pedobacter sp.]